MTVIEDRNLTDTIEDWSRVRSPSRAARRRRQGHLQNITYRQVPKAQAFIIGDKVVMHPETAKALREMVDQPPKPKGTALTTAPGPVIIDADYTDVTPRRPMLDWGLRPFLLPKPMVKPRRIE